MNSAYIPLIAIVVSVVMVVIQALTRYGVAKTEEGNNRRFEALETAIEANAVSVQETAKQIADIRVAIRGLETQMLKHSDIVSRELFDAKVESLNQQLVNISKVQAEVVSKLVKVLHQKETAL
jgi:BMFP domain-containing protein YqiC